MKDVNSAIRKKYFELLNGSLIIDSNAVLVYSDYLPSVVPAAYYVVIQAISNTSIPTKTSHITSTTVQIRIFTKDTIANPGKIRDLIAGQIYFIIYPNPNSKINLEPEFQVVSQQLDNDNNLSPFQTDTAIYLNRFITFSHKIYHRKTA